MVDIVNTPCSWVIITRCADKSMAEYTKYITSQSPPTHACTHTQMHAHTHIHHGRPCRPHSYLILPILFLPSFFPSVATLYLSIAPPCPFSISSSHRKIKSGTQGRNNPPNKGAKRIRGETTFIYSYRQISSHQFIMVTPTL